MVVRAKHGRVNSLSHFSTTVKRDELPQLQLSMGDSSCLYVSQHVVSSTFFPSLPINNSLFSTSGPVHSELETYRAVYSSSCIAGFRMEISY